MDDNTDIFDESRTEEEVGLDERLLLSKHEYLYTKLLPFTFVLLYTVRGVPTFGQIKVQ